VPFRSRPTLPIDATILIPTHDHAAFLPTAIRSALSQRAASFEVLVVGDGVQDDTREAMEQFAADDRVRFFDLPKGQRNGERLRHDVLQESRGEIVCYLSDDDVFLPWHVEEMLELLQSADFAHALPVLVDPDRILVYRPADLARPEFRELIRVGRNNFISLTGAAHTRALYDRLPYGWRPAPPRMPTDIHMWTQVFSLPDVRGATGRRLTAIHLPNPAWRTIDDDVRIRELESWLDRALQPGGEKALAALLDEAILRASQDFKLRSLRLSDELEQANRELELLETPWWKKLARRVLRFPPARALRERLR
jgi:glycosyltransferase involved in cell wall biosynthesis